MKIRVLLGSIKLDDTVYAKGQTLELDDTQAKAIIREGVAEEVQLLAPAEEPKKEETPVEEKADEKPKEAPENTVSAEPSLDWTRRELVAHATSLGIEDADKLGAKEKILEAIQAKGVKTA